MTTDATARTDEGRTDTGGGTATAGGLAGTAPPPAYDANATDRVIPPASSGGMELAVNADNGNGPTGEARPHEPGPVALELRRVLDGSRHELRTRIREALDADWFVPVIDPDVESHRARTTDRLLQLARTGFQRTGFPDYAGGAGHEGHHQGDAVVLYEMLGNGDISLMVKAGVQWGLFGGAVGALGTEYHHRTFLPGILDGTLLGCFAMTETGHGSDVQQLGTTATYDPATEEFVIDTPSAAAEKNYIGNAARDGRMAVVFAQLETRGEGYGVHAFLVPIRGDDHAAMPGVRIGDCGSKGGLGGVDNGRLSFERVRVPRVNLLNAFADVAADGTYSSAIDNPNKRFFTTLGALVRGRISVGGAANSGGQTALTIAVRYGLARRQFPGPDPSQEALLLDFPAHQRKLLPLLARTYAFTFAQDELATMLSEAHDAASQRRLEGMAAGVKALSTWHAGHTVQVCREACGGAGYLAENRLTGLRADLDIFTTFEGDNTVLLQLMARGLLTSYRDQLADRDTVGMVRTVASQVGELLVERLRARGLPGRLRDLVGRADTALRDPEVQADLLGDREEHVLEGLARRIRRAQGKPDDEAWHIAMGAQSHMLQAARAHIDNFLYQAFRRAVARADGEAKDLLGTLCDLYFASTVETHLAWYMLHDRLQPVAAREVSKLVDSLCQDLRPHARTLVDGFGLRDAWLAATLVDGA